MRLLELDSYNMENDRTFLKSIEEHVKDPYKRIQGQFLVANYLVLPLRNRNFRSTVDDHYKLLEYLRNKDMEQSEKMIAGHINNIFYIITNQK